MALVISPVQAAAIMLPILITQDVVTVWAYRHTWDGRNLAILLPGAALGIGLGYLLAARVGDLALLESGQDVEGVQGGPEHPVQLGGDDHVSRPDSAEQFRA